MSSSLQGGATHPRQGRLPGCGLQVLVLLVSILKDATLVRCDRRQVGWAARDPDRGPAVLLGSAPHLDATMP